jgi:hypothetical protein
MFSKEVTNSSDFLMMSQSAQSLYFHIGMNSDDDGFCELFTIVRMTESKPDDIQSLHSRGFIYIIDSKVCIVKDWHTNNYIQSDRYQQSKYLNDLKYGEIYKTIMAEKIANIEKYKPRIQNVSKVDTQVRLGKVRKEEEKISSFKKYKTNPKPYYNCLPMRFYRGKWWVIPADGGDWLEFADSESKIIYK